VTGPPAPPGKLDRASGWMIAGALAFATMGALTNGVGSRCDWLVVALVRAVVMLGSAATMARASGSSLVLWRPRTLWVRSLAGSFSLVGNFYALTRLPLAEAVTLMNVHPLWIVLITSIARRSWPGRGEAIGVACGMAGVVLVASGMAGTSPVGRPQLAGDRLATLAAVLSSLSTAVAMLGLHRLRRVDPRSVVAHFAGVATLVSATLLVLRGQALPSGLFERPTILLLLGVGVTGTLGQILLTKAYSAGAPSKVAVIGLIQVVFAMGFDVVLWHRALTPATLAGFALVLAPTTWLSIRSARSVAPPPGGATSTGESGGHRAVVES
jgi:drug/metabolite transporter (DMT)-like permease